MQDKDVAALVAAIVALEGQRATLGDTVFELAVAPLRARLAALQRPSGLQRRQVTVLFADIVGSTAMASSLDAEDTLDVLSGALRGMVAVVEAHQGRVLRLTGDGVKAAFGMDDSREDDPDRAVRAGLALLQAAREHAAVARLQNGIADFAVRVGVHTGDVALGAGVEADNTAMGATVNVAARMEQSAPPGTLRISHDTWNHVRGLFVVEPQPPLPVKGVEEPMRTYLVRAALDRGFAGVERGVQGLSTPMVGRHDELRRVLQVAAEARNTRQLQALTLVGDAGLGKSRMLRELLVLLTADPASWQLLAIRSLPDGMLRPWGLLRSLLAVQCGVADTDSAEVARRKVVDGLAPWFDEHGEQQAQLIGQLSGLDFGDSPHVRGLAPRSLRDRALSALVNYLQALATRGAAVPLLVVVEDLHWADDGSLDLLRHLCTQAADLPLALVMTARPALLARRPDWGTPETLVMLSPLAAAHSGELVQALLQRLDAAPPRLTELTALIQGLADGNPYYMEELVRRLLDDGVITVDGPRWTLREEPLHNVRLPGTLVGLLQVRLNALPANERQAVRQASVIGHVFWDDALQAVDSNAPQALPALQQAAFVRANDKSDFEGTAQRQFDHHLLHQVTYDTLLKSERRLGHGAAARWLAERTQGRGAEFLAMTGEHAERAGNVALAADCFDQAALQARNRFANAAAIAWLRRAVALLGETDPGRCFDLLYRVQVIHDQVGDRSAQDAVHAELAALLERYPDEARQSRLWFSMALLCDRRGDKAASERHSQRAFDTAQRCGAALTAAGAQSNLAWLLAARQDYMGAIPHLALGMQWAARIADPGARADREAQLLTVSGFVSMQRCRFDEARVAFAAVVSRGEELGMPRLQLGAMVNLALAAAALGRWDESASWSERMAALAQSIGAQPDRAEAQLHQALAAQALGNVAAALRLHEQSLEIFRATGSQRSEAVAMHHIGALHLEQGDAHAALPWLAQAQTLHDALGDEVEGFEVAATTALCECRLSRHAPALATVSALLGRLSKDLARHPAHTTIALRWTCQQVLESAGDTRAVAVATPLFADVQARASELTDAADRDRLIEAVPVFRAIVAAYRRRGEPNVTH